MRTSEEVINFVKKNLEKKFYISMFVAGSVPEKLTPQSDLDIFIVMKNKYREAFFNNLNDIMDRFMRNEKNLTYSFYRGPLKYKNKGLVHFIIYTDVDTSEGASFKGELLQMLRIFKEKGSVRIISGQTISELTEGVDWNDKKRIEFDMGRVGNPYKLLLNKNLVIYKQCMKVNGKWKYTKTWKRPSKFLANYLSGYYLKNLSLKEFDVEKKRVKSVRFLG